MSNSFFRGLFGSLVFVCCVCSFGQAQSYLQKLRAEAKSSDLPVETRLEALYGLSGFYFNRYGPWGDPDSSLFYAQQYLEKAKGNGEPYHLVRAYVQVGNALLFLQKPDEAKSYYSRGQALNQQHNFPDLDIDFAWGEGQCYYFRENPDLDSVAICFKQAFELSQAQGDQARQARSLQFLARSIFAWTNQKDSTQYLDFLTNTLTLKADGEAGVWQALAAVNLATYYFRLDQDSLAQDYMNQAFQALNHIRGDAKLSMGLPFYIWLEQNAYDRRLYDLSMRCLKKIVELTPRFELSQFKTRALFDLGLHFESDYNLSLYYYQWCEAYADSVFDSEHQVLARNNLGNVYKSNEDVDRALRYFEEADSILKVYLGEGFQNTSGRGIANLCSPTLNAGDIYLERKEFRLARQKYFYAWRLTRKWGQGYDQAVVLNGLVNLFEKADQLDSAWYYLARQEALLDSIPEDQVFPERELFNRKSIAGFRHRRGDHEYAVKEYYPWFLAFSEGDTRYTITIQRGAMLLYESFKALGKKGKALEMLEIYQDVRDSLNSASNQRATLRIDFEQKALRDSLVNVQAQVQLKTAYDRQVQFRNYMLITLVAMMLLGVFLFQYRRQERRAKASEAINQRLRQVDQLKDQFLANTSHELRTPLHGIIGLAEGMYERETNTENRQNLSMLLASGKRLASLVNDLLDFSRLKNADLALRQKPLDLHSLVNVVLQVSATLVQGKNLVIRNEIAKELPAAMADEDRLSQVLFNLIGNSIKFTEAGTIAIRAEQREGQHVVSIADTGIGIAADKLESIFDEFSQADGSIQREYAGTGLGLSISRQLIEAHGGKMWAESQLGRGSTFFFTLPISKQDAASSHSSSQLSSLVPNIASSEKALEAWNKNGRQYRILIVDDEPINHQVLKNHLSGGEFLLSFAMNGIEALTLLEEATAPFDLMLLDIMMPKMSGYEVAKRVRERFLPSELPIILVTAKNQVVDLVQGLETGANDYLAKPFSRDEFLARLRTHLNLKRINQASSRFLPREFIQSLGREDITEAQPGDYQAKEVTVFFSDIRDYTGLSESMTPEENFGFVQAYARRMGPIILENQGFVNQYLGDGIMAIFQHSPDHALQAAIAMQESIRVYNLRRKTQNRQLLKVGMGMHTGSLILGIIGDERRSEASVIADTVNIAARLEGLTKFFGAQIVLSEDSYAQLQSSVEEKTRYLGLVQVKGRQQPMGIYECFAADSPSLAEFKQENRSAFHHAIEAYMDGNMERASHDFRPLAKGGDLAANYFLAKAQKYLVQGLPKGWIGVDVMEKK